MDEQRILLTGATGTLGRNLLDEVAAWPDTKVLALVRAHSKPDKRFDCVEYKHIDFLDKRGMSAIVQEFRPTSLVHCAASGTQFPRAEWFDMIRFNVDVSLHLCESVSQVPGCQFVYISTGLAYRDQGRPLREFSFSGVGDVSSRLFPSLLRAAQENSPFCLSPGNQVRDHCAATDIVHGISQAILKREEFGLDTRIFNLGSSNTQCLRKLIEEVVEDLGLQVTLNFGARDYARFEPMFLAADISTARTLLGWQPRINFDYAIWQLAQESFPSLKLREPASTVTSGSKSDWSQL